MHSNRSSLDDTDVLKKELATVQRLMDELATDKERELADLQKKLADIQTNHAENNEAQTTVQGDELIVLSTDIDILLYIGIFFFWRTTFGARSTASNR